MHADIHLYRLLVVIYNIFVNLRTEDFRKNFSLFRAMRHCADHRGYLPVQVGLLPIFRAGHPST
jgi:hypothetical protein